MFPVIPPTYDNQLAEARRVLAQHGAAKLERHARIGRQCRCDQCACCAAWQVYSEYLRAKQFIEGKQA